MTRFRPGRRNRKNPGRDLPIAIIGSLLISTVIYVLVSIAAVGVAPVETLTGSDAPLAAALREGAGLPWAGGILAAGALVAITTVVLVIMYGQTRIFFAMCRDGMFPRRLAHVHPRFGTPARLTIGFGILIAILAAFIPLGEIVKLVNIGTLFAFLLVNIGVLVLRRTRPDMPRPFRVPLVAGAPHRRLPVRALPDVSAAADHLGAVHRLADRRPDHLLRLLPTTFADPARRQCRRAECARSGCGLRSPMSGAPLIAAYKGPAGPDVLCLAKAWSQGSGRPLHVVTVYPGRFPIGMGRTDAEWVSYNRQEAEELLDQARTFLTPEVPAEFRPVAAQSASGGLHQIMEEGGPGSTVIVGSRKTRGVRRTALGSTAGRLLQGAPGPVALVPWDYDTDPADPIRRVGVAFVDTPDGHSALTAGVAMATELQASLHVITVVPDTRVTPSLGEPHRYADEERAAFAQAIEQSARRPRPVAPRRVAGPRRPRR